MLGDLLHDQAGGERVLAHDGGVVIFASGRITKPGERYQPKTGVARMAFATGSPIVPFYLTGTERIFADGRPRVMRRVRMVFGEPIGDRATSGAGADDDVVVRPGHLSFFLGQSVLDHGEKGSAG